jgi:hypothetical protein
MSVSLKFCQMCYAALENLQKCHGHDCYAKGSTWELRIITKVTQFGRLPEAMHMASCIWYPRTYPKDERVRQLVQPAFSRRNKICCWPTEAIALFNLPPLNRCKQCLGDLTRSCASLLHSIAVNRPTHATYSPRPLSHLCPVVSASGTDGRRMAGPRAQTGAALSMDWQNEKKLLIALNPLEGLRKLRPYILAIFLRVL